MSSVFKFLFILFILLGFPVLSSEVKTSSKIPVKLDKRFIPINKEIILSQKMTIIDGNKNSEIIILDNLDGLNIVNFWASWCAPCLTSLPLYNELYHKYKDQGLEVVAITVDNPIEDGLDFLEDTPLDFLIPADPEGDAAELFGVIGMPTSYLIGPDGEVKLVHMGFRPGDMEEIEAAIVEHLPR